MNFRDNDALEKYARRILLKGIGSVENQIFSKCELIFLPDFLFTDIGFTFKIHHKN